ncbi:MAG: mevalonate kinase [Anaerolineaceae bacterium]|nr:mevalonate kinase [Anaerolineaceae bacterium]
MPVIFGKAPGKIILFGEHAVVYGQPAIAIPVQDVTATARVTPILGAGSGKVHVQAHDIHLDTMLNDLPEDQPLAAAIRATLEEITPYHTPSFTIQLDSTIPIAAGMGSGAAVTVAIIRALSAFLGEPLPDERISEMAYEIEKIHHGTPSGIDNTVVTFQKPVYFQRGEPLQTLTPTQPTYWVIADTGEKTPTIETVSDVRELYESAPDTYEAIFAEIGQITRDARLALCQGDLDQLGPLMNRNQELLQKLEVSSPRLEKLINAARESGAVGAKLSGGGRGGNMIALTTYDRLSQVEKYLMEEGAVRVMSTVLREAA